MNPDNYVYGTAQVHMEVYFRTEVDGSAQALQRMSGEHTSVSGRFEESSAMANDLWVQSHPFHMPNEFWQPAVRPVHPMPEFNPTYIAYGNDNHIFNAIYEIKALWEYVVEEALHNYSAMYSKLWVPIDNAVLKQMCQRHKEAFAVYDKKTKAWLVDSNEPTYRYCYNGEDFEEFEVAKEKAAGNRLLLVGKYTILMQEPNLVRETTITSSIVNNFKRPNAKLVVGVPGCGKTTYIIDNHTPGSLVLTSCAEAAADIRSRMGLLHDCSPSRFRDSYRTIDSYLLHSRRQYSEVWIDEALMEHPGKLFLVCLFSRCQILYMLGDPNQLGYINRVQSINLYYEKTSEFFNATQILNVSYRCPVDVMAIVSCKYDGGAYSTSDVMRSMQCVEYSSLYNIPREDDIKYLVFKQAEKKVMKKAGYKVSTIHEFQGKEAETVVIVRMSRNLREPLYESVPHILVGITRHRKSLIYYTPVADVLHTLINTQLTDEQLQVHRKITKSPLGHYDFDDTQDNEQTSPKDENSPLLSNRIAPSESKRISFETDDPEEEIPPITFMIARVVSIFRRVVPVAVSAYHWIWSWFCK